MIFPPQIRSQSVVSRNSFKPEEYYNHERPHAGLGGRMIKPRPQDADGEIVCTERLRGLLKYYHRERRAA